MGKVKIGSVNHQNIVKGDVNLLKQGEILISTSEGYTILRKRESSGKIKTFVVIPLEEFNITKETDNDSKVSSGTKRKDIPYNKGKNNGENINTPQETIKGD